MKYDIIGSDKIKFIDMHIAPVEAIVFVLNHRASISLKLISRFGDMMMIRYRIDVLDILPLVGK
jgi:hypothetical protein